MLTNSLGKFLTIGLHCLRETTGDCIALKYLIVVLTAAAAASISLPSVAEDSGSGILEVAAANLAGRLGELRGAVRPDDRGVFLTKEMLSLKRKNQIDSGIVGGIRQSPAMPHKPILPPIVWKSAPEMDRLIDQIMSSSSSSKQTQRRMYRQPFRVDYGLKRRNSELEDFAESMVAQFVPQPITKLKIFAGKYAVTIPVRR